MAKSEIPEIPKRVIVLLSATDVGLNNSQTGGMWLTGVQQALSMCLGNAVRVAVLRPSVEGRGPSSEKILSLPRNLSEYARSRYSRCPTIRVNGAFVEVPDGSVIVGAYNDHCDGVREVVGLSEMLFRIPLPDDDAGRMVVRPLLQVNEFAEAVVKCASAQGFVIPS